jgi:hypothetical protein
VWITFIAGNDLKIYVLFIKDKPFRIVYKAVFRRGDYYGGDFLSTNRTEVIAVLVFTR